MEVIGDAKLGETVLLPVKVLNHGWADNSVRVEFDEGPEGKTTMHLNRYTPVCTDLCQSQVPIEVDDIVFVAFKDGQWRVADRCNDQLFLTPHMDMAEALSDYPRRAMVADVEDCYHVSPLTKEGRRRCSHGL